MTENENGAFDTYQLNEWVDQIQQGDHSSADRLFKAVARRLEHLAHKMLKRFPAVARWEETDDVLQNSLVRLLRALGEIKPKSTREFFGLAAMQIRRELLDMARRYQGANGLGRRQAKSLQAPATDSSHGIDPADVNVPDDLELWARLHENVERLPTLEREVFSLVFYHGWKQADIGALLQIDERTVRRRWNIASDLLNESLEGRLPTK